MWSVAFYLLRMSVWRLSAALLCACWIKHGTTAAKSLTAELVNRVWLLESLLNSSLKPPTSQHEEQDAAQLQGKGQHAQRYDGAVAC